MGIWSDIKDAAKKVVRVVKGAVRVAVKFGFLFVGWAFNIWDLLFGFLNWPPKKLTLHIVILQKMTETDPTIVDICKPSELQPSIDQAERILRERFNVRLRPYAPQYAQVLVGLPPEAALNPSCCDLDALGQEFLEQGEWYAGHTAGWVASIPTSVQFPITAFVVNDVQCKNGCSIGPLSDYIVMDRDGVFEMGARLNNSLLMHEIGHCCNLFHPLYDPLSSITYLMFAGRDRGDDTHWWQRNLFRSSRHVTYW
jgi:hypothetical protein